MADCIVKPSFLRGFDFKFLHASAGLDEYRVMSLNPLTGEILACPYGGNKFLRSTDWGYTFEDFVPTGLPDTLTDIVVYSSDFGLNRHFLGYRWSSKDMPFGGPNAWGCVVVATGTGEGQAYNVITANPSSFGDGVVYANGGFWHNMKSSTAYSSGGYAWKQNAFSYRQDTTSQLWQVSRWAKARGQWVYGVFSKLVADKDMPYVGIGRAAYPDKSAFEFVSYFIDADTSLEVSDFVDYDGLVLGGAALILRDGTIWRHTSDDFQDWVAGATPPTDMAGFSFPHLAAGKGKFNEPVLVAIDSSGAKGLLSRDHGVTQSYFDLPHEVSQTLPGGVVLPTGTIDARFPRVYDLKYVPDPATNFTKGRWILCAGLAIWEMIPVYGE